MICKNCGFEIKENTKFCPQCGSMVEEVPVEEVSAEEVSAEEVFVAEPVEVQKPKGSKGPLWIGLSAVAIGLVVAIVLNLSAIGNFFKKTFSSDEAYLQYVNSQSTDALAEDIAAMLNKSTDLSASAAGKGAITITVGEDALSLLKSVSGMDFDWLSKGEITFDVTMQDRVMGGKMVATVNDKDIISMDVITDLATQKAYIRFADFNQQYLCVDMNSMNALGRADNTYYDDAYDYDDSYDYGLEDDFVPMPEPSVSDFSYGTYWNTVEAVMELIPDEKTTAEIIKRYLDVVYANLGDVEKEADTVEIKGVSQNATKYTAEIDNTDVTNILDAFLKEVRGDAEIEKMIKKAAEIEGLSIDMEPDALYDGFKDAVDNALSFLAETPLDFEDTIVFNVWVDGNGNVVGRELDCNTFSISAMEPQQGKQYAYELEVNVNGQSISFEGLGTVSGNQKTGEYALEVMGMDLLEIDVKDFSTENGLNGSATVTPASSILSMVGSMEMDSQIASMLRKLNLQLDFANTEKKSDTKITVLTGDDMLLSLDITGEETKASEVAIPTDAVDATDSDAMETWASNIDFTKLIDKLEEAGVPSDLLNGMLYGSVSDAEGTYVD